MSLPAFAVRICPLPVVFVPLPIARLLPLETVVLDSAVVPENVLFPEIDSLPVVCTRPVGSILIVPAVFVTVKPFTKFSAVPAPFDTPSCCTSLRPDPLGPVAPVAPVTPVAPVAPVTPVAPVAPVAPVTPCMP